MISAAESPEKQYFCVFKSNAMNNDEANARLNAIYTSFANHLKALLEAEVEHLDINIKANQIRKFIPAATFEISSNPLSRGLKVLNKERVFPYLIDRIAQKEGLKERIIALANQSREAVIAIVNPALSKK